MHDRTHKTIIWLLSAAVGVALVAAVFLSATDGERRNAMRNRAATLRDQAQFRNLSRPVLRGEPLPGNAWDEYNLALDDAQTIRDDERVNLVKFVGRIPGASRASVEQLLAAHRVVIEHLRLGAQRSNGQYPYEWTHVGLAMPSIMLSRQVAMLAAAQARIWSDQGRNQEASDLLLDLSQFAGDLGTNGPLLSNLAGIAVYFSAFDELRDLVASQRLNRRELSRLAETLKVMDRNFPAFGPAMMNEAAWMAIIIDDEITQLSTQEEMSFFKPRGGWRHGFSARRMLFDAFEKNDAYAQRYEQIDRLPFAAAEKEMAAIVAEIKASDNPMLRQITSDLTKALATHRQGIARLRLLRAAAMYLSTGETLTLDDPFGTKLRFSKAGDKLKIWSIGSDGTDQNGRGTWESASGHDDIVVEISR